jgi:fructose-1,6-bisphosphatase/inositol monophosphatase family enzyme
MHALHKDVSALMMKVAAEIVMPRYQSLAAHEMEEKTPGDLVTIADKESELALNEGLAQIEPSARMIGEEACAANPKLLDGLKSGAAWIIDPIDGTNNFASGRPPFAIMVALVEDGVAQVGWMLDPITGRMCHAVKGSGAFINGERVFARGSGEALPKAGISTLFMDPQTRTAFLGRAEGKLTLADIPRCAGEQYPRIVLGGNDLALFERVLPWDHVSGALFVEEAGGKVARLDGSAYQFWDGRSGLLAAGSPGMWDYSADILNG